MIYTFFARVHVLFPVRFLLFFKKFVCVLSACVCTHVCADAHRGQKRAPDALELELQAVGNCLMFGVEK